MKILSNEEYHKLMGSISSLTISIHSLEDKVWKLVNPPAFKYGDIVYDSQNNEIKITESFFDFYYDCNGNKERIWRYMADTGVDVKKFMEYNIYKTKRNLI